MASNHLLVPLTYPTSSDIDNCPSTCDIMLGYLSLMGWGGLLSGVFINYAMPNSQGSSLPFFASEDPDVC